MAKLERDERGFEGEAVLHEALAELLEGILSLVVAAQRGGHLAFGPAQAPLVGAGAYLLHDPPRLGEQRRRFLAAAAVLQTADQVELTHADQAGIAEAVEQVKAGAEAAGGGLVVPLVLQREPAGHQRPALEMGLVDLAVDGDGIREEVQRLVEAPLGAAQGSLELQDQRLVEGVEPAPGEEQLRGLKGALGLAEVAEDPEGVAEISPGPDLGRFHRAGAVLLLVEPLGDVERQPQEIFRPVRSLQGLQACMVEEELMEPPALEAGVLPDPGSAPLVAEGLDLPPEREGRSPFRGEPAAMRADLRAVVVQEPADQAAVIVVARQKVRGGSGARQQCEEALLTIRADKEVALEITALPVGQLIPEIALQGCAIKMPIVHRGSTFSLPNQVSQQQAPFRASRPSVTGAAAMGADTGALSVRGVMRGPGPGGAVLEHHPELSQSFEEVTGDEVALDGRGRGGVAPDRRRLRGRQRERPGGEREGEGESATLHTAGHKAPSRQVTKRPPWPPMPVI